MGAVSKPSLLCSIVLLLAALMLQGCQTAGPSLPGRGGWHPATSAGSYTPEYEVERELAIASSSPDTLVGTDAFGIEGLTFSPMDEDDDLELTGDISQEYEPKPMPRVRARTRRSPSEGNTAYAGGKNLMCTGSELLCVTSPYGVFRGTHVHKGVDLRAPFGSPIKAFRGGKVTSAQYSGAYGYMVEIAQTDGLVARYAHMSQMLAREGDRVVSGQVIGRVGSTGRSTGPHLHFELIRNNGQLNPLTQITRPGELLTPASSHDSEAARAALSAGMRAREAQASPQRREKDVPDHKKNVRASREAEKDSRGKAGRRAEAEMRRSGKADAKDVRKGRHEQAEARKDARKDARRDGRKEAASAAERKKGSRVEASSVKRTDESARKNGARREAAASQKAPSASVQKKGVKDQPRNQAAKSGRGRESSAADQKKAGRAVREPAKKEAPAKNAAKASPQKKGGDKPARKERKS